MPGAGANFKVYCITKQVHQNVIFKLECSVGEHKSHREKETDNFESISMAEYNEQFVSHYVLRHTIVNYWGLCY